METTIKKRLRKAKYNSDDCDLAIAGKEIPQWLGHRVTRFSVIRGIRYHPSFGSELHNIKPEFTRALNARRIMSNEIPSMSSSVEMPYCIWHPDLASEATYRELAKGYPGMKYLVGRACAVAGYNELYKELGLLPEVHIAEEARECGNVEIYDLIMAREVKYETMNDYERTIFPDAPKLAFLNGDTAVVASLGRRQPNKKMQKGFEDNYFNITEDMNVGESGLPELKYLPKAKREDVSRFLYTPLPRDLPTNDKDLLICMAAYYGDVDRYARLRRPTMIKLKGKEVEQSCVVHGIYHNAMFAQYWALQSLDEQVIRRAIHAKRIMCNDLSHAEELNADPDTLYSHDLPWNIWHPTPAHPNTYVELARMVPSMKPQIGLACIISGYERAWDQLNIEPCEELIAEAGHVLDNSYFSDDLRRRVEEIGRDNVKSARYWADGFYTPWSSHQDRLGEYPVPEFFAVLDVGKIDEHWNRWITGCNADAQYIERSVLSSDEAKDKVPKALRELQSMFDLDEYNRFKWDPGLWMYLATEYNHWPLEFRDRAMELAAEAEFDIGTYGG